MNNALSSTVISDEHIIIYVESRYDAELYQLLCGAVEISGFMFKPPLVDKRNSSKENESKGGWRSVQKAVNEARAASKTAPTVFGLLDGEEASRFGRGSELFEDPALIFSLDDPAASGLLFLGCFEKENLYLRHGDVVRMMQSRLATTLRTNSKNHSRTEINPALDSAVRLSIVKCATKSITADASIWPPSIDRTTVEDAINGLIKAGLKVLNFDAANLMKEFENAWPNAQLKKIFIERMNLLYDISGINPIIPLKLGMSNRNLLSICDGVAMLRFVLGKDRDHTYEDMAADFLDNGFQVEFRRALRAAVRGHAVHATPDARARQFSDRQPLAIRLMDKWRV